MIAGKISGNKNRGYQKGFFLNAIEKLALDDQPISYS